MKCEMSDKDIRRAIYAGVSLLILGWFIRKRKSSTLGEPLYLSPKLNLPTNPSGTYVFPFGPEWRNEGPSYVEQKPPPPLFGPRAYGMGMKLATDETDSPYWIYA